MSTARPFRLGVLFVHGIGIQPAGETLVRWGDALVDVIARGTGGSVTAAVDRATVADVSGKSSSTAELRLSSEGHAERWLLSEGWWAEAFPAPRYRELVSWSIRALPWSIAIHIAQRYWQTAPPDRITANVLPAARALLQLVIALMLAPFLVATLALGLVLGALPIPQLRAWILAAQSALTATIGDSLAFVESPVRAALIRTRILDRLEGLERLCERTIVVAHSQGAAAVVDALGGLSESPGEVSARRRVTPETLLTFGAGTNQLVSHKVLSTVPLTSTTRNAAGIAVGALLATAGLCAWLYANIRMGETTATDVLLAAGMWIAVMVLLGASAAGATWLSRRSARRWRWIQRRDGILVGAGVTFCVAVLGSAIWYADRTNLPFGAVNFLALAVTTGLGSLVVILSHDMKTVLTAVRKPPGLDRWIDIYASADPVPQGPTMMRNPDEARSIRIWNSGSLMTDHTSYWDNLDGFVLRVVRACATTAESPWANGLPDESDYIDRRARWRVQILRLARWPAVLAVLIAGAVLGARRRTALTLPFDVPGWITLRAEHWVAVAALTLAAAWAASYIVKWLWRRWVEAEQDQVLRHRFAQGTPWEHLAGLGIVVWLLLIAATGAVRDVATAAFFEDPEELLMLPILALGLAVMSGAVLLKLVLPPPAPAPAPESAEASAAGSPER